MTLNMLFIHKMTSVSHCYDEHDFIMFKMFFERSLLCSLSLFFVLNTVILLNNFVFSHH